MTSKLTLQFEGTHGTSRSAAEKILGSNFLISTDGQIGFGVYFWVHTDFGFDLARGYHARKTAAGDYSDAKDGGLAVLRANIETENDHFYDLSSRINTQGIQRYYYNYLVKNPEADKIEIITSFLLQLEEDLQSNGCRLDAVVGEVDSPKLKYLEKYKPKIFGKPKSLAVRRVECIKNTWEVKNEGDSGGEAGAKASGNG